MAKKPQKKAASKREEEERDEAPAPEQEEPATPPENEESPQASEEGTAPSEESPPTQPEETEAEPVPEKPAEEPAPEAPAEEAPAEAPQPQSLADLRAADLADLDSTLTELVKSAVKEAGVESSEQVRLGAVQLLRRAEALLRDIKVDVENLTKTYAEVRKTEISANAAKSFVTSNSDKLDSDMKAFMKLRGMDESVFYKMLAAADVECKAEYKAKKEAEAAAADAAKKNA